MKFTRIAWLILLVFSTLTVAQTDEQKLLKLEEQFLQAKLKNDVPSLEKLIATEFFSFNQFAEHYERVTFLELFKTFKQTELINADLKVIFTGDNAMVAGKLREVSTSSNDPQFLYFVHVWAKRGTDWKIILQQQQFDAAEGTVTPKGWAGGSNENYLVGTDNDVKYGGTASVLFKPKFQENKKTGTGITQQMSAEKYRGKRIRLTGYLKGEINYGRAYSWMRVDAEDGEVLSFDNTLDDDLFIRQEWEKFTIVLDVPEKSALILFGLQVNGRVKLWADDLQLEVVEKDIASTNQLLTEARTKQMEEFKTKNSASWQQRVQSIKKMLPTLQTAPVNLDFETIK